MVERSFAVQGPGYCEVCISLREAEALLKHHDEGTIYVSLPWLVRFLTDRGSADAGGLPWQEFQTKYGTSNDPRESLLDDLLSACRG